MQSLRFGRKVKLPATKAIKHQILSLMLQDHLKAQSFETDRGGPAVHAAMTRLATKAT